MRTLPLIGAATFAVLLATSQFANAERVCKERCEAGSCVKKCVESEPDVVVREREHVRPEREHRPGIDLHVPGVNVDIGH